MIAEEDPKRILRDAKTIAVLGMKGEEQRHAPAHRIPIYLAEHGYEITPVNPKLAGRGYPGAAAKLSDLDETPDIVEVFRRSEHLAGHLDDFLAAQPGTVWFQQGIRDDAVALALRQAGIQVVQDSCMYTVHLGL